jgi:hypothetical protein
MNRNFSRAHFQTDRSYGIHRICPWPAINNNNDLLHREQSLRYRWTNKLAEHVSAMLEHLAHLRQLLVDYPLSMEQIEQLENETIESIVWNTDRTMPIAIDQNHRLNHFRQNIREYLHLCLEYIHDILIVDNNNEQIYSIMNKCRDYVKELQTYHNDRYSAYLVFQQTPDIANVYVALIAVDQQQFYRLRHVALYLQHEFVTLITWIRPMLDTTK